MILYIARDRARPRGRHRRGLRQGRRAARPAVAPRRGAAAARGRHDDDAAVGGQDPLPEQGATPRAVPRLVPPLAFFVFFL